MAELSVAMALYRAIDMTFWLPQVEMALAQAGGATGAEREVCPVRDSNAREENDTRSRLRQR